MKLASALCGLSLLSASPALAGDWPQWRGPNRDGISPEKISTRWTEPGPKELGIRSHFDLSPTRYYQVLAELLDRPEADGYDPLVVRRLRRLRERRRRARYEGRSAGEPPVR